MRSDFRSVSTVAGLAAPNSALIFRFSKTTLRACRLSAKSLSTFGLAHGWRRLRQSVWVGGPSQLMLKVLWTVTGAPPNGGTCVPRKRAATHPPTGVPAKGGPSTLAVVAVALLGKVTPTRPGPLRASGFLHDRAAAAWGRRARRAGPRSKSPQPPPARGARGAATRR